MNAPRSRVLRILLIGLAVALLVAGAVAWRLLAHPSLEPYRALELPPATGAPAELLVRFLGVTTILLDDGETRLLTDGFFSRPGARTLLLGKLAPDEARIDAALERAGITRLAAVMTAHSHHDHAMDAASVALRTGALLIGSESTANLARGLDFPAERLRVVEGGESFRFGRFTLTLFRALHSPDMLAPGAITAPLRPPAELGAYREGGSFSFLIEHDGRRLLIHPSTNFVPGQFAGVRAEVLFLGMATLGKQSDAFVRDYWRETVQATGAQLVIPIHWDDFLRPLDQPLVPMPALMDDFTHGMEQLQRLAQADGVRVRLLPLFEPVDVFAALR